LVVLTRKVDSRGLDNLGQVEVNLDESYRRILKTATLGLTNTELNVFAKTLSAIVLATDPVSQDDLKTLVSSPRLGYHGEVDRAQVNRRCFDPIVPAPSSPPQVVFRLSGKIFRFYVSTL